MVKAKAETEELLVPLDTYMASGIHIGTKIRTKQMMPFVYKINPNGLCTLNLSETDRRLRLAAKMLSKYNAEDILVVCRRENGWQGAKGFGKYVNAKVFTGRYPAGIITNPDLSNFFEPKLCWLQILILIKTQLMMHWQQEFQ